MFLFLLFSSHTGRYQQKAIARKARAKEEEFQRRERRARAALENNRKTIKTKIKTKAESRRQREVQAVERREAKVCALILSLCLNVQPRTAAFKQSNPTGCRSSAAARTRLLGFELKVQRLTDQAEELRRAGRLRMEEIDAKMRAQKEEFLATRRSAKSLAGARAEREAQVSQRVIIETAASVRARAFLRPDTRHPIVTHSLKGHGSFEK